MSLVMHIDQRSSIAAHGRCQCLLLCFPVFFNGFDEVDHIVSLFELSSIFHFQFPGLIRGIVNEEVIQIVI